MRYYYLSQAIQESQTQHSKIIQKRQNMESRVAKLRGKNLDVDFLEELVHKRLGFMPPDAVVYLENKRKKTPTQRAN